MTADIRTAAQREAGQLFRPQEMMLHDRTVVDLADPWREAFVAGAVWAAARVTPTREQIAEVVRLADGEWNLREGTDREDPRTHGTAVADAVLALMQGLAEGGSSE